MKSTFAELFSKPAADNGFAKKPDDLGKRFKTRDGIDIGSGDVLIAAITSCTNTSNPSVLLAAGLLAKKAVERGLTVKPHIKTSLAPGSRVVTEYLTSAKLLPYLEKLGFYLAGYGCTTCIGNAGPLAEPIEEAIVQNDLVCAAVLSGNRNFEARIHPNLRANFLASPPLVVAYAIAGTVLKDLMSEPLGKGKDGEDVWIGDIWPTSQEIYDCLKYAMDPKTFQTAVRQSRRGQRAVEEGAVGRRARSTTGPSRLTSPSRPSSRASACSRAHERHHQRAASWVSSATRSRPTTSARPARSRTPRRPASTCIANGVAKVDFNSYGARRGNHEVMMRGTFANVRIKNLMVPPKADGSRVEGGVTIHQPSGEQLSIYDAAMKYIAQGAPTVVFGGEEYGTGSSRDWAAKGTQLLGVKAVVARSFERIHRSNLVGMGVLPLQFLGNDSAESLGHQGRRGDLDPRPRRHQAAAGCSRSSIKRKDGSARNVKVKSRIDTAIEVDYYKHGGILPYVLRDILRAA